MSVPTRDANGPLLFAIDHCFPIKGQGTLLTGTVLSGSMKVGMEIDSPELTGPHPHPYPDPDPDAGSKVGMEIDFPELKQQRKVKSMQMFKKPINAVSQGDRVGVCVTQLDAKSLERGIA